MKHVNVRSHYGKLTGGQVQERRRRVRSKQPGRGVRLVELLKNKTINQADYLTDAGEDEKTDGGGQSKGRRKDHDTHHFSHV